MDRRIAGRTYACEYANERRGVDLLSLIPVALLRRRVDPAFGALLCGRVAGTAEPALGALLCGRVVGAAEPALLALLCRCVIGAAEPALLALLRGCVAASFRALLHGGICFTSFRTLSRTYALSGLGTLLQDKVACTCRTSPRS
jgi:hypothetical protein